MSNPLRTRHFSLTCLKWLELDFYMEIIATLLYLNSFSELYLLLSLQLLYIYIKALYNMGKRTWTDEEKQILYENFPEGGIYKCIELLPGKTRKQIKAKIDALHIKSNHYDRWTPEENVKLKEAWETYSMEDLLKAFPGRTYQKIELHAHWLGYHAKVDRSRKCDLSFLDLNALTKESLYWWGFIMADGHLSKTNTLIITLKNFWIYLDTLCGFFKFFLLGVGGIYIIGYFSFN